jgi:hypothetical protein
MLFNEKMEEMRRRGGRNKQLSDDLEENKICRNFKAKELDRPVWRSRFSSGFHKTDNILMVDGLRSVPCYCGH